ncbi:MAG: hypothetical protein ACRC2T_04160, partial [Thermoguttaceae bacterium]
NDAPMPDLRSTPYLNLAVRLKSPQISWGDLKNWSPPQNNLIDPRAIGGIFIWVTIIMLGIPGMLCAVLHIILAKHDAKRKGVIIACVAVFIWPIIISLLSFVEFFLEMGNHKNTDSYDYFIVLVFAIICSAITYTGIYWTRRYLRPASVSKR